MWITACVKGTALWKNILKMLMGVMLEILCFFITMSLAIEAV